MRVQVPEPGVHGCARSELELACEAAIGGCAGSLALAGAQDADIAVAIQDDAIVANVSGIASVTFHLDEGIYPEDTPPGLIATDALSCIAAAIARAGHGEPAARVAVQFFPDSLLSAMPPIAPELAAAMAEAGRIVEVIEIAERLDQDGEESRETSGAIFMHALLLRTGSFQPQEADRYEAALRGRFARRIEAGRLQHAAAAAENVGMYLMNRKRPADAIEFLEQARELDPTREDEDLAQAIAGALFLTNRYSDAVPAYDRVLELAEEADPAMEARRADALMRAGRYRDALEAFGAIETEDTELSAWIYVKRRALMWVIEATGIEQQEPQPGAADELAGTWVQIDPSEHDALAQRVWALDAASSFGWFNYARDLLDRDREEDAMHAYLTAAVMREGDVEAWVNVALLAGNVDDADLFVTSAITANRLNEGTYMAQFVRHLRETVSNLGQREGMLTLIRRAVDSVREAPPTDGETETENPRESRENWPGPED